MYKYGSPEYNDMLRTVNEVLGQDTWGTTREQMYILSMLLSYKHAVDVLQKELNMERAVNVGVQKVVGDLLSKAVINV